MQCSSKPCFWSASDCAGSNKSFTCHLPAMQVEYPASRKTRANADFLIPIQVPAAIDGRIMMRMPASAKRITTRQQHRAARTANRRDIEVAKLEPRLCELVDDGSLILLTAVTPKPVFPNVVQEDKYDVRRPRGGGLRRRVGGVDWSPQTTRTQRRPTEPYDHISGDTFETRAFGGVSDGRKNNRGVPSVCHDTLSRGKMQRKQVTLRESSRITRRKCPAEGKRETLFGMTAAQNSPRLLDGFDIEQWGRLGWGGPSGSVLEAVPMCRPLPTAPDGGSACVKGKTAGRM